MAPPTRAAALLLSLVVATSSHTSSPTSSRTSSPTPSPLPVPDYLGYASAALPLLDASWQDRSCVRKAGQAPCDPALDLASAHALHADLTNSSASLARVSHLLYLFVESWRNATANGTLVDTDASDFFACKPAAVSVRTLVQGQGGAGLANWTAADVADLKSAVRPICATEMFGAWNQAVSRAAGVAIFVNVFPDVDPTGALSAYAQRVYSDVTSTFGYAENSPVYNSIFFGEGMSLGSTLGLLDGALQQPLYRSQLEHWLSLLGPSGWIPAWGDAWDGAGGSGYAPTQDVTPWGIEDPPFWTQVFEIAAKAYGDAAFAWGAASMFRVATGGYETGGPVPVVLDPRSVLQLLLAAQNRASPPIQPVYFGDAAGPSVSTRVAPPARLSAPDKLLLFRSRQPCGAANATYAVVDLFASSELYHCHTTQVGALAYYSAGGVDFVHWVGRDNRLPEFVSLLHLFPSAGNATRFPYRSVADVVVPGGTWRLAELPTNHMMPVSQHPADYYSRNLSTLLLVGANTRPDNATTEIYVGYVTLYNAATGAEAVLDDFSADGDVWPNTSVVIDPSLPRSATKGALVLSLGPGTTFFARPQGSASGSPRPLLPGPFDSAQDWTHLRFYWRVSSNTLPESASLFSVGTGPYTIPEGDMLANGTLQSGTFDWTADGVGPGTQYAYNFSAGDTPAAAILSPAFFPNVTTAYAAENGEGDTFGSFTIDWFGSTGATWQRAVVALAEGPLVVVDSITVGPADDEVALSSLAGPGFSLQVATDPVVLPVPGPTGGAGSYVSATGFNATGCYGVGAVRSDARLTLLFAGWAPGAAMRALDLSVGQSRTSIVGKLAPAAAFARTNGPLGAVAPGGPSLAASAVFVSVLVPHDPSVPDASVASATTFSASSADGSVTATIPLPRVGSGVPPTDTATVSVGADMLQWSVTRTPVVAPQ
jgi:hypothetical protein